MTYPQDWNTSFLLSIEGNIGAGKTTFVERLKISHPEWVFVDEPVGNWLLLKDEASGKSLLELYYEDRSRWGYTFQTRVLLTRMQELRKCLEKKPKVVVLERSLESDRALFASLMKEERVLNSIEWQLYEEWYTHIQSLVPATHHFLWLDIPPEVCAERIVQRSRQGEQAIGLDYLQKMDTVHKNWLGTMSPSQCIRVHTNEVETILNAIHSRWFNN